MTQLSLFGADVQPPSVADLEGLLAGPAQVVRRDDAARISVVCAEPWRVEALVAELAARVGVAADVHEGRVVRTPFLPELRPLADRWTRGAVKRPPEGWRLDGRRLRWWCLAAGHHAQGGYTLTLGAGDELVWPGAGAALAAVGLAATFVGPRADGPAYRLTGRRRLARLRELVGDPPAYVPVEHWPAPVTTTE